MLGQILKELRLKNNLTQLKLGELIGVSDRMIGHYEKETSTPPPDIIVKLAEQFNVTTDYLLGIRNTVYENQTAYIISTEDFVKIPVFSTVYLDHSISVVNNIPDFLDVPAGLVKSVICFAMKVPDDSMCPILIKGDTAIVKKCSGVKTGDIAVVCVNNNTAIIRKVIYGLAGITLQPLNHVYEPVFYSYKDIEQIPVTIIGHITELRRFL